MAGEEAVLTGSHLQLDRKPVPRTPLRHARTGTLLLERDNDPGYSPRPQRSGTENGLNLRAEHIGQHENTQIH